MDIKEMQAVWSQMTVQIETQKKLTDKLILDMTQERFKNRFNTISKYEGFGAIICFIMAFFVLVNIQKLDTWYLLLCGIFSMAYLVSLPLISLNALKKMKSINFATNNYKQTLQIFIKSKRTFLLIQRTAAVSSFIFMLISLPVASKLINGKDIFLLDGTRLIWLLPTMGVLLFFFARWGYRCYKSITVSAENILNELDGQ